MDPAPVGAVTVTLRTTAETPVVGTLPCPVIWTARVLPAARGALGAPVPLRVSSSRAGASGANVPAAEDTAGVIAAADAPLTTDVVIPRSRDVTAVVTSSRRCRTPLGADARTKP